MSFKATKGINFGGGVSLNRHQATESSGLYMRGGGLNLLSTGPHAIGGAADSFNQLVLQGTFTPAASGGSAFRVTTTLVGGSGETLHALQLTPTMQEFSSGTHSVLSALRIRPTITAGGANTTDALGISLGTFAVASGTTNSAGIKIDAPTGATNNYALWIATGESRIDGAIVTTAATTTPALTLSNVTAGADWLGLAISGGTAVDGADNDLVKIAFQLYEDGTPTLTDVAEISGVLTDASTADVDGAIRLSALDAGTMTDVMQIGFNTSGTFVMAFGAAVGTPVAAINFTNNEATEDFTLDDAETTANNQQVLGALINTLINLGLIS